jgi:hypothetical protein
MPRLSLGLGVSSSSKLPSGGVAPSGIPVASTSIITAFASPMVLSVSNVYKISPSEFTGEEYYYSDYSDYISITFNSGIWTLYAANLFDSNVQSDATYTVSGVADYIPQANAGWTPEGISFIEFVS